MTGRSMTTFINTILNHAYIDIAIGTSTQPMSRLHVGDDVVMRFLTRWQALACLDLCMASKSCFNKRKQSIGISAEFLRHAVHGDYSYGYVNRSLSSFVCGSWVSKLQLAGYNEFAIFSRYCWTIDNRAICDGFSSRLFSYSLFSKTNVSYGTARSICAKKTSVDGSPVSTNSLAATVLHPRITLRFGDRPAGLHKHASTDYVNTMAKELKSIVQRDILGDVVSLMARASYSKSLLMGYENDLLMTTSVQILPMYLEVDNSYIIGVHKGILSKHPTLPSLKGLLSFSELDELSAVYLGVRFSGTMSVEEWFFGHKTLVTNATLGINYDDASQMGQYMYMRHFRRSANLRDKRKCFF